MVLKAHPISNFIIWEAWNINGLYTCSLNDHHLCFYQKLSFVNEKTEKYELCHFSQEIYVINSCPKRENVPKWVLVNNNLKNENRVDYKFVLGNFWPKKVHGALLNFFAQTCLNWNNLVNIFENWWIGYFFSSIFGFLHHSLIDHT